MIEYCLKCENLSNLSFTLIANGKTYECDKLISQNASLLIKQYFLSNNKNNVFCTEIPNIINDQDLSILSLIFNGKKIIITNENVALLYQIGVHFEMDELIKKVEEYNNIYNIHDFLKCYPAFTDMKKMEMLLLSRIDDDNFETKVNDCKAFIEKYSTKSFLYFLLNVSFNNYITRVTNPHKLSIQFIKKLEESFPGIISLFLSILLKKFIKINNFYYEATELHLVRKFQINSLMYQILMENLRHHLKDEKNISQEKVQYPKIFHNYFSRISHVLPFKSESEIIKINKNNKNIITDPLAIIIENDDITLFQTTLANSEISNEIKIKSRISKFVESEDENINLLDFSLIEYSAFCGSINCFNYLITKKCPINKNFLAKYAIAGGNLEIVHICERENCIFNEECLNISIQCHRHKLTKWLMISKNVAENEKTLKLCIENYNITSLSFLLKNKIDDKTLIFYSCKYSNALLLKCIGEFTKNIKNNPFLLDQNHKNALHFACEQNNIEIVRLLFDYFDVDVNSIYEVFLFKQFLLIKLWVVTNIV